jgi:hypothetical protein
VQEYLAKRNALKLERDTLEQELTEVYTRAAGEIVALFQRVNQFKQRAQQQLGDPPANVEPLPALAVTHLLDKVQLFDFDGGKQTWPPASSFASDYVSSINFDTHPGQHWSDPEIQQHQRAELANRARTQRGFSRAGRTRAGATPEQGAERTVFGATAQLGFPPRNHRTRRESGGTGSSVLPCRPAPRILVSVIPRRTSRECPETTATSPRCELLRHAGAKPNRHALPKPRRRQCKPGLALLQSARGSGKKWAIGGCAAYWAHNPCAPQESAGAQLAPRDPGTTKF